MSMVRGTALLLRGTILAQVLGVLALPLMSRLFPVEAFGQFQIYQSIMLLAMMCASLRYEIAVLNARGAAEIAALIQLCALLIVGVAGVFTVGVAVIVHSRSLFGSEEWRFGPMLIAIGVIAGGANQLLSYIVTRLKGYGPGGNARVLQGVAYCGSAIGIGAVQPISTGVILADIVGKAVGATHVFRFALHNGIRLTRPVGWRRIFAVARRYRAFALVSLPSGLVSTFTTVLASFMLLSLYGPNIIGQFGLVERTATAAVNLITVALAQVFTSGLSDRIRGRDYFGARNLFRKTLIRVAILLIMPCAIGIAVMPTLFVFVFGNKWAMAGRICQVLVSYYFISTIQGIIMYALMTLERQRAQFALEGIRLCAVILGWGIVWRFGLGPLSAIAIHFGIMGTSSLVFIWLVDRALTSHLRSPAVICVQG